MNKILMTLMALSILSTTQADLHDDHKIDTFDHCMDALGKDYADLDDAHRHRLCDKAAGAMTWGELKNAMDDQHHKDKIDQYQRSHG